MRLTCPNCDAQYEVPDEVIPASGRDVQCSNCGNTWFVAAPGATPPVPDVAPDMADGDEGAPDDEAAQEAEEAPQEGATEAPEQSDADDFGDEAELAPPRPDPAPQSTQELPDRPPQRTIEPDVAQVLREEAEFEARARAAEADLETQPDLGLSDPASKPASAPAADVAGAVASDPEGPDAAATAQAVSSVVAASRRDLLPDIEEINSTLRATTERQTSTEAADHLAVDESIRRRKGFRVGFGLALLIFGLAAAIYAYAPAIIEQVPAVEPALSAYVDAVNNARLWLEDEIQEMQQRITNAADRE